MGRKKKSEKEEINFSNLIVDRKTISDFFCISTRTILDLVNKGMPKKGEGEYHLLDCVNWYVEHLKGNSRGSLGAEAKEKILNIKAKREELLLKKEEGKLIELEEVVEESIRDFNELIGNFMGYPGRVAPKIVGKKTGEIKKILDIEIRNTLRKYSRSLSKMIDDEEPKKILDKRFKK